MSIEHEQEHEDERDDPVSSMDEKGGVASLKIESRW